MPVSHETPRRILFRVNWFTIGISLELIAIALVIIWIVTH
jgi:hypothetical protein